MGATPKIRFKGFTDDWEQRRVGDIAGKTYGGGTPKTSVEEYWKGDIPWIQSSNLSEHDLFYANIQKHITETGLQKSAAQLVPEKSIAVVSHVGVVKLVFLPFEYATSQDFISLSELKSDPVFTCYVLYKRLQEDLHIVQGSAIKGITKEDLLNKEIMLPSGQEQEMIGTTLRNIDHLITLHQRKCDEIKELKKYMLQKMFPQNGKKIPEIRFSGFTDDWEQRKLGEITERVTRKNQDLESELPLTISAQYGLIDQIEFFDKRVASKDVSGYYLIQYGEFAYNKSTSSDAPWGAVKRLDRYEKGVLSTLYIVFRIVEESKTDSDYIATYYDTNLWHKGVQAIAAEGARNHGLLNIAASDFFETILMVPRNIDEQKRIGRYFKMLDNLITLHQRKCDELKEVKKFMLQNMFPQKG